MIPFHLHLSEVHSIKQREEVDSGRDHPVPVIRPRVTHDCQITIIAFFP